jgi:hypothetical protein
LFSVAVFASRRISCTETAALTLYRSGDDSASMQVASEWRPPWISRVAIGYALQVAQAIKGQVISNR